jgi:tetratricopeptide (TPR) repeat protein
MPPAPTIASRLVCAMLVLPGVGASAVTAPVAAAPPATAAPPAAAPARTSAPAAASSPAASETPVTDDRRIEIYKAFRAAFDARDFAGAQPLAEQLVALTEAQYGADHRQLVNPLTNLGTVHFRLGAHAAAEAAYQRALALIDNQSPGADRTLIKPLLGLGETWLATGRPADAAIVLKRAIDLSRNLDGLFNVEQLEILDPLVEAYVALDRVPDAEKESQYAFRVAESAYGRSDLRMLEPLDRLARWNESLGRYTTARGLHARSLQIAETAAGRDSVQTVAGLRGLARSYYLEFIYGPEEADQPASDPFSVVPTPPNAAEAGRLNPEGERALRYALELLGKAKPIDRRERGATLVELADWYLIGGAVPKANQAYALAWSDLAATGDDALRPLQSPRRLAYRPPAVALSRMHPDDPENYEERFVEARFKVLKDGKVADAETSATDTTPAVEKGVLFAVRKSRYAPRLENGVPVDTEGVTMRERVLVKRPPAPKPAAGG